jgi:hypothetical protein
MGKSSFVKWARGLALTAFAAMLPAIGSAQSAFPPSTGPNAACGTNSLASYQALGFAGCTVGTATFYNFTSSSSTNTNFSPSAITVTPTASGQPSVGFNSSLFSITSGFQHYTIEYYVDPPIDIIGLNFNDDPFVNGSATIDVCVDNTFAANCPLNIDIESVHINAVGPNLDEYFAEIDPNSPSATIAFDHTTQFMDVIINIDLDASNGPASVDTISQSVTLATPEPDALALSAIGFAALFGVSLSARRRARKNRD